ncbi:hypothetical protein SAMN00777080_0702 [Aquiflexum balticum DSM 16537]|uniref:Uncharacterized protein n=1 Tax=Aquiflexum balticum DSM 16537 TaxID=758820 RepID=A0A1W2GZQ0_9BACT|nr:hypothetical protein SAMN00777080_0702 [Aquiflexum balticum DSM 16537]
MYKKYKEMQSKKLWRKNISDLKTIFLIQFFEGHE